MGLSKANDIQRINAFVAKELKQGAFRCYILTIEGRIRGLVHALVDGDIRVEGSKGWVQLGLGSTCNAVRRPGINEVGMVREMRTRIDMPILRGHNAVVIRCVSGNEISDALSAGIPTFNRKSTALAKSRLNINNDERAGHYILPKYEQRVLREYGRDDWSANRH